MSTSRSRFPPDRGAGPGHFPGAGRPATASGHRRFRDAAGAVSEAMISGVCDVFTMRMYYSEHGNYQMNNHVVEFEQDRRIGWEPEAGQGHPDTAPDSTAAPRWGHRWSFELTPDGPDATIVTEIYDCSRAPEDERAGMDNGRIWIESMAGTLERLDRACTGQ